MTSRPSRREALQIGAACCLTAAAGCDAGPGADPVTSVVLGVVGRLRRELADLPGQVRHFPKHRIYLALWDPEPGQESAYPESAGGFVALTEKCPHLGCRLPFCGSSAWFECPCHGSRFNRVGEYQFGPAPTGQVRFRLSIEKVGPRTEELRLHRDEPALGAPRGTATIKQEAQGPHCVG